MAFEADPVFIRFGVDMKKEELESLSNQICDSAMNRKILDREYQIRRDQRNGRHAATKIRTKATDNETTHAETTDMQLPRYVQKLRPTKSSTLKATKHIRPKNIKKKKHINEPTTRYGNTNEINGFTRLEDTW
jgi:hypothetical protein